MKRRGSWAKAADRAQRSDWSRLDAAARHNAAELARAEAELVERLVPVQQQAELVAHITPAPVPTAPAPRPRNAAARAWLAYLRAVDHDAWSRLVGGDS